MLLLEDNNGRKIYISENDIKSALRVSDIVCVPDMVDLKRGNNDVLGIIVNLADYSVGAVKGAKMAMFDDFDIDYNQHKFLIETRISGSLLKPASALVIEKVNEDDENEDPGNGEEPVDPENPGNGEGTEEPVDPEGGEE